MLKRPCPARGPIRRSAAFPLLGASALLISLLATVVSVGAPPAGAIASSGAAYGFGANSYGQVGVAATGPQTCGSITCSTSPVAVGGLPTGALTIASGARHTLALLGDGTIKAWGRDGAGELGDGGTTDRSTPGSVLTSVVGPTKLSNVIAVDGNAPAITSTSLSGDGHNLAIRSDHTVWAWGANGSGQQGINPALASLDSCGSGNPCSLLARAVPGLTNVTSIATGAAFNLALKSDGSVWAWGLNASSQLGVASTGQTCGASAKPCSWTPVQVTGLGTGSGVTQIAAGSAFAMALKSDGTVLAWGNNDVGELGDGTIITSSSPVTAFSAGSGVVQIAAGDSFAVARKSDGSIWSWGNNTSGQLGNGTLTGPATCGALLTPCSTTPAAVLGLGAGSTITSVSAGFAHAVARKSNGTLVVWGRNQSGQLGDGSSGNNVATPKVLSVTNVAQASASGSHTAILRVVAPAAPTGVLLLPGTTSLAVGFTAPAFAGGSVILDYTASCLSSNLGAPGSATGTTSPVTVTGLTTGKTYTCRVRARNAIGSGPASVASPAVIVGTPAPPTVVITRSGSTTALTGPATVSFSGAAANGSPITGYWTTCTSSNGGVAKTTAGAASPIQFSGTSALTTAKSYTCTVRATNARGTGPASKPSAAVIVGSPAPPTIGVVTKTASGSLSVSFTPGANNGSAITGYTARCTSTNGGIAGAKVGAGSPLVVTALTTTKSYRCTVAGTNARGTGLPSALSAVVLA